MSDRRRRREQFGVSDSQATPEQQQVRVQGMYDPRPASGALVARRVRLRCCRCGVPLGHVDEHEVRILFHSIREKRWTLRVQGMKCQPCFEPLEPFLVDMDEIERAISRAQRSDTVVNLKLGARTR